MTPKNKNKRLEVYRGRPWSDVFLLDALEEIHNTPIVTITKKPRKNKPGAGRPRVGRTANLPRIRPEYYADLKAIAQRRGMTIALTLEGMIADDAWMTGGTK
jgi:hypothetical protein